MLLPSSRENELKRTINAEEFSVSAIISVFNSRRFIQGRLKNLVTQTLYKKNQLEIIIVDSNSSQNEKAIIQEFMNRHKNIEYIYTSRTETVYGSWNRGIRLSKGRYIINANTDDRFTTYALECMANVLNVDSDISAVYGDWLVTQIENDFFESNSNKLLFSYPDFFPPLLFYYQITSHAPLIRKEVFDHIGFFDDRLKVFGDRDFMFRFATSGLKAKKIPFQIGLYLDNPKGLENTEGDAESEFTSIRNHFLNPDLFVRLFGFEKIPDIRVLAELYAVTGSLGKDFYRFDNRSTSDFVFAVGLLCKALEFDPKNIKALNNLGVVMSSKGKPQEAIKHFESALEAANLNNGRKIKENLQAAKAGSTASDNYNWILHETMD
jgi:glycosyltransferase involved in cell wall biosynthesis